MDEHAKTYSGKGNFKADFSMWGYEYERIDLWIRVASEIAANLPERPDTFVQYVFSLKEIYRPLRPLVYESIKKKIDESFKEFKKEAKAQRRLYDYYTELNRKDMYHFPYDFNDKLDALYDELMELRQVLGLGIPVTKQRTDTEKIKRVLGG